MGSIQEDVMRVDRWGYQVNTTSDECIAAINLFYDQELGNQRNSSSAVFEAAAHDERCVLANTLAAHCLSNAVDAARARAYLDAAQSRYDEATEYEKAVFDAVSYLMCNDDRDDDVAINLHAELLDRFPRDMASLKRALVLCFYAGQPTRLLHLVNQVQDANREQSYFHGIRAFPLLELGLMLDAEKSCIKALEINKRDVWAQHCLCHVLQYECRFEEAIKFMEECSSTWDSCSTLRYTHNWWHTAVCYLQGYFGIEKVLDVYDNHIMKELEKPDCVNADVYIDALGLLLRLHVYGQSALIEPRLQEMTNKLVDKDTWHVEWLLDLLSIWALARANDLIEAENLLHGLRIRVSRMNKKKEQLMRRALLLALALYEYGKGNYDKALVLFGSEFSTNDYKMVGASDEQLDVFNEIWYCLLLNSGQVNKAISVIEKRLKTRPGARFMWQLLEKGYLMMNDKEKAQRAVENANNLEIAYSRK